MNKSIVYTVLAFAVIGLALLAYSFAAESSRFVAVTGGDAEATNICTEEEYIEFGLCEEATPDVDILVMTKASVHTHDSIPAGKIMLSALAEDNGFTVEFTEDSTIFLEPENVEKYEAVLFLNTDSVVFDTDEEKQAFRDFIELGKGFIGIHGASATHWNKDKWDWYAELVGARFVDHPPGVQEASINTVLADELSTQELPDPWIITDEWYNYTAQPTDATILLTIDESTYTGGTMGDLHPVAWRKTLGDTRSWYTNIGHESALYTDDLYIGHVLGGIQWVLGAD